MARLNSLKSTWDEYKGWFFLLLSGYVIYCFRGLFSAVGGAAGDAAAAATAGVAAAAQKQADTAKVKAAAPGIKKVTDAQLATWRADAEALAGFLGHVLVGWNTIHPDQQAAFTLLKQKYSRLNLLYNKPFYKDARGQPHTQSAETSASLKNAVNYTVLAPFYKEVTNGRNMVSDIRQALVDVRITPYLKWVL